MQCSGMNSSCTGRWSSKRRSSAGAHLNFGTALSEAGRKAEAIDQYRAAIELNPDYVGPHDQLAFALLDQGDLPGATSEMREVVRLQPGSADARNNLALALKRSGQLDSAITEYKAALSLNPNSELALNNLGSAYLRAAISSRQSRHFGPRCESSRTLTRRGRTWPRRFRMPG